MRIFLDANVLFSAAQSAGAVRQLIQALQADGHLLSEQDRSAIEVLVAALQAMILTEHEAQVLEDATQALAKGTEAFAAERMNRGIQQALAGKNIESV